MGLEIESDRYPDTGFSVRDTSPEVNRLMFERTMALTGEKRFLMGISMFDTARSMILASLPDKADERERKLLVFERTYGTTLEQVLGRKL